MTDLPVACYCGAGIAYYSLKAIRDGSCGWSCGRRDCSPNATPLVKKPERD